MHLVIFCCKACVPMLKVYGPSPKFRAARHRLSLSLYMFLITPKGSDMLKKYATIKPSQIFTSTQFSLKNLLYSMSKYKWYLVLKPNI